MKEQTIIIVPARGGSKRLPRKNVLSFDGKPLIAWTIEQSIDSGVAKKIIVSSDDSEILNLAEEYKDSSVHAYKRNDNLATDTASTADVVLDVINYELAQGAAVNTVILLQATSPLRTAADIESAYGIFHRNNENKNAVLSVCKVDHPTAWCGEIGEDGIFKSNLMRSKRSQDYPDEYRPNGAIYIGSTENILRNGTIFTEQMIPYIMPVKRSYDIDEGIDFKICEYLHKIQA